MISGDGDRAGALVSVSGRRLRQRVRGGALHVLLLRLLVSRRARPGRAERFSASNTHSSRYVSGLDKGHDIGSVLSKAHTLRIVGSCRSSDAQTLSQLKENSRSRWKWGAAAGAALAATAASLWRRPVESAS